MAERDRAFVEFVEAARPSLRRTAYLMSGDWHTADDVVQETLYKLYLAWPKVQRMGNPFAYARRMLVNVAYDSGRRPWRREVAIAEVPEYAVQNGDFAAGHAIDIAQHQSRTFAVTQRHQPVAQVGTVLGLQHKVLRAVLGFTRRRLRQI